MSELALEHGRSLRLLIARGHLASALALIRIQLDSIIRTVWIHFCANDEWVRSATTFHAGKPIKEPTHALTMTDLLTGIQQAAPAELHRQLSEFKTAAWPALSSYVHSGIWPVLHGIAGDEEAGSIQTLRNSCGLTGMAAMMIAVLSGMLSTQQASSSCS